MRTEAEYLNQIVVSDALAFLQSLPDESVNQIMTSPPYFGLRDYGSRGQIGLEKTPAEYVATMVQLFREARRVLKSDGTFWLNLGDSYANDAKWGGSTGGKHVGALHGDTGIGRQKRETGFKAKDLMMIPARVAIALQDDGWILRSDIIWEKPNCLPESVKDRPTKSYEHVFLLAKSGRYFYDWEAIQEPIAESTGPRMLRGVSDNHKNINGAPGQTPHSMNQPRDNQTGQVIELPTHRNKRDVWTIPTMPYPGSHFATFPPELIRPMILAGCPKGGLVLDPFMGAGTTALVAWQEGRNYTGSELNPEYADMARARVKAAQDAVDVYALPLFKELGQAASD